ncbi:uncharacterized protein SPPG_07687 [Spizellomyces punctatus DAOM BR117]|uniref:Phosphatidylglycerol/phosphatidylinositol transfer protein n=1 Tax=Spizellomyces punctatus (strain DAOM BR117) TaxID=645134 RepID=A0A0L0H5R4_SPIPD|nr:uncharacterized protein SPPG_07687 [Spizellomyces punctatus DAOM BR117]KNC96855.1 hypothetical protein SPPG_07687 [Spizellomyces punctatus DAOM BR117]|eukprot:XP_016604895.1 hypothetical protein SPPG_07687 [Spizellomyces punctatus DAOM BR117]
MHFLSTLLLASIPTAIALTSSPLPWSPCSADGDAQLKISNVQATYDSETRLIDVYGEGTTQKALTNGTVKTNLAVIGFEYWENKEDICNSVQCPVAAGKFIFNKNISLPANVPLLDWKPRIIFQDATSDEIQLGCISIHLGLSYSVINYVGTWGSVFTAVAAGVTTTIARLMRFGYHPTIYDLSSGWAPTARLLPSRIGPGFMDVALLAQFAAASGQLNFDYPIIYQDFVSRLAWATGTWNVGFITSIANNIRGGGVETLRQETEDIKARTGDVRLNRRQTQPANGTSTPTPVAKPKIAPTNGIKPDGFVTGYDRYAAMLGLHPKDIFLHTLIPFVLVVLIAFVSCTCLAVARAVVRSRHHLSQTDAFSHDDQHHHIRHYLGGWLVRILILFYFGLTSTSLHQLTLSGEPSIVYTLAGLVFATLGVIVPITMTLRLIAIARMNRRLDDEDPEIADQVYARSIRDNIGSFTKESVPVVGSGASIRSYSEDTVVAKEAAQVYTRMRALSVSTAGTKPGPESASSIIAPRLRAFSVSSKRSNQTAATSASRSASWPLPPLYLSQKFMLLYGPFFNQYDPTHYISHAEFLIALTWWLRVAPAFSVGILGKLIPPYLQFAIMISGDAALFAYLIWKNPFVGKPANRWQLFLVFCRSGIFFFLFVSFLFRNAWHIDWIAQLISYIQILSIIGIHLLFLTAAGLKFVFAALKGFKRKEGPPIALATDPVNVRVEDDKSESSQPSLPREPMAGRRMGRSRVGTVQRVLETPKLVSSPGTIQDDDAEYFGVIKPKKSEMRSAGQPITNKRDEKPSESNAIVEQRDAKTVIEDGNPYLDV